MAPPSHPGTSTHTTVTSAGPPAAVTASRSAIGSRASATATASARPAPVSRSCSPSWGTTPIVRAAPACAGGGQAEGAGLARPSDDGDDRGVPAGGVLLHDARGERRGAADVHHAQREGRVEVVRDDGGDRAAEEHGVAVARHLLAVAVPAGQAVLDDERGQREADQGRDAVPHRAGRAATRDRPPRRCRRASRRSRSRGSASCRGSRRCRAPPRGRRRRASRRTSCACARAGGTTRRRG